MSETVFDPVPQLADELRLPRAQVEAAIRLLSEENTVPFIARYRKEVTGGLDEVQLRAIEERRGYLTELEQRRQAILESIAEQDKLSDELRQKILAATTKAALEDLYLPYKRKRKTRATVARQRGLEPLAQRIVAQPAAGDPLAEAEAFVTDEVPDAEAALAGARDIVAEIVAETAEARALVRQRMASQGVLVAECLPDKAGQPTKYEQYYDFREGLQAIPSHRFLAIRRGEREKVLRTRVELEVEPLIAEVERLMGLEGGSPFALQLAEAIGDGYHRLLASSVESDLRADLKQRSDTAAVEVFAANLRDLLLAAPLGPRPVVGIDPGLRTGCKCAALDQTGRFVDQVTIYPSKGEAAEQQAREALLGLVEELRPAAIAVGNGTGGRETESFVRQSLRERTAEPQPFVVQVNESGASVYSASPLAREEFPELDLTIRGAISIGRRLQDPLAELVKIDPKAIGVGQYQHDVHQPLLQRKLGEVVESCVNHVGVDLNTASASLLAYVAGIGKSLAKKIVAHREQRGAFRSRVQLTDVSGLGPRAFEQAAGFLRVREGAHALDASAVHPERYPLVERIADDLGLRLEQLVGDASLVERIEVDRYLDREVGEPTLRDIIAELKKPGRDPRQSFEPPRFRDDVNTLEDLQQGMTLEGVVTNVTAFGAFVDIGVHQDGLVHVSELADRFVRDPKEVVKVGDKVSVRVLAVDLTRRRISLSARSERSATGGSRGAGAEGRRDQGRPRQGQGKRGGPSKRGERGKESSPAGPRFSNNPFAKLGQLKRK
jgi:uncharacterized protein